MTEDTSIQNEQQETKEQTDACQEPKAACEQDEHLKKSKDKTIKIKESEYQRLVQEAAEYKDKHVRLYAEFDNARKRMDREKQEFVKYANEGLIIEFIGILDSLEASLKSIKEGEVNEVSIRKGIEMVIKQMHDLLSKNGVQPIKAVGTVFDHNCHEVLMQEESAEHEDMVVLEEFQKGYTWNNKVLRTTKVKIAKKIEKKDS